MKYPEFEIGELVRFIELPEDEFIITGYLLDDDDDPIKSLVFLKCQTKGISLGGSAVHSSVLEAVPVQPKRVKAVGDDFYDPIVTSGIELAGSIPFDTPHFNSAPLQGGGGSFDGGGASADWTESITSQVGDTISSIADATGGVLSGAGDLLSTTIETSGDFLSGAGDTIGDIAEGLGDVAGGILGAFD